MELFQYRSVALMDKKRIDLGVVVGDRCVNDTVIRLFRVMISSARRKSDSCIFI